MNTNKWKEFILFLIPKCSILMSCFRKPLSKLFSWKILFFLLLWRLVLISQNSVYFLNRSVNDQNLSFSLFHINEVIVQGKKWPRFTDDWPVGRGQTVQRVNPSWFDLLYFVFGYDCLNKKNNYVFFLELCKLLVLKVFPKITVSAIDWGRFKKLLGLGIDDFELF